jgi:hypothetical protein
MMEANGREARIRHAAILRDQLDDTLCLQISTENTKRMYRHHPKVTDLLNSVAGELDRIARLVEISAGRRGLTLDMPGSQRGPDLTLIDGGDLEQLVSLFCKYSRNTTERRASAERTGDQGTAVVLDHIASRIDDSISLLDIYSNALAIRAHISRLPTWDRANILAKVAS